MRGQLHLRTRPAAELAGLCALHERLDHRGVRHILAAVALRAGHQLHLVEVLAPALGHRAGIDEVLLVQLLDERRIAAEEVRVAGELLHHGRIPFLALVDGLHFAAGRAFVQLARTADLLLGVGDHLVPLRDPADRAG